MIDDKLTEGVVVVNKSRKAIGLFVSLGLLAAVLYVTVVAESDKKALATLSQTEQAINQVAQVEYTGDNTPSVNSNIKPVVSNTNPVQRYEDDRDFGDDGEEDDDGGRMGNTNVVPPAPTPSPVTTKPTTTTTSTSSSYKDGTYSAVGTYMSPGGQDQISVSLTLSKDLITSVDVTPLVADRTSAKYMDKFIGGYKSYVVGKSIASLSLSKVSGASLTPIGFNNAITQIKAKAKA
jgi:uncharacterized protein with FMN-binding domain